ncbi:MAG: SWIM zinc finger family protein [Polyangiaceae bacterium]
MTVVALRYSAPSEVTTTAGTSTVRLALDATRGAVGATGRVLDAELLRDALLAAIDVRESDLRYKGRDRAAYLAWLVKKGKKASAAVWEAQKAFLDSAYSDDLVRARGLDPLLTVDRDALSIEVFSRDESAYARLSIDASRFDGWRAKTGTTVVDLSPAAAEQIERIRTYQPVSIDASTSLSGAPVAREIELPAAWLRGFLQVQSAATLPRTSLEIAPVDLYSALFGLRLRRTKKAPRSLRFELVPGAAPRLVLEPWDVVIEGHGPAYDGKKARVVKTYGRQRLLTLARLLPHVTRARVHLLGPGLPTFWVLDLGPHARFTLAMTSWSESSWASATSFDALMPREGDDKTIDAAVARLGKDGPAALDDLASKVGVPARVARAALQRAALQGRVLYDLATDAYRARQILAQPIDEAAIRYGSEREARAHRLLGDGEKAEGSITIVKLHVIAGEGIEIWGEIAEPASKRTYTPRFLIDGEDQVQSAWCNCATYQRSQLREGPCEHMLALRVHHRRQAEELERQRNTPEGRRLIVAETRTLLRRDARGREVSYRVSLDGRVVLLHWVDPGSPGSTGDARTPGSPTAAPSPRFQRMGFDTGEDARRAYFTKLEALENEGFVDASDQDA